MGEDVIIIPVSLYKYFQLKLYGKANNQGLIDRKVAESALGNSFNVPKNFQQIIIEEMFRMKMLVKVSKYVLKVKPIKKVDLGIFYRQVRIF